MKRLLCWLVGHKLNQPKVQRAKIGYVKIMLTNIVYCVRCRENMGVVKLRWYKPKGGI